MSRNISFEVLCCVEISWISLTVELRTQRNTSPLNAAQCCFTIRYKNIHK